MSSSRRHGHTRYSRGSCYRASRDAPIDKMVETYYTCPPLADTRHSRTHTRLLQPGHHRARLGSTGTQKRTRGAATAAPTTNSTPPVSTQPNIEEPTQQQRPGRLGRSSGSNEPPPPQWTYQAHWDHDPTSHHDTAASSGWPQTHAGDPLHTEHQQAPDTPSSHSTSVHANRRERMDPPPARVHYEDGRAHSKAYKEWIKSQYL